MVIIISHNSLNYVGNLFQDLELSDYFCCD
jgi:hypothetical protein